MSLLKLLEAITMTDGEIHCSWEGSVLSPKSVVLIDKLEKPKAKELTTKLD